MNKRQWRTAMVQARDALPPPLREAAAIETWHWLSHFEPIQRAKVVFAYASMRSELPTQFIIESLRAQGKRVALPRMLSGREMEAREGTLLVQGRYGVMEPREDSPQVLPEQIDVALVPGLAFDDRGHRLGYGAGYYDRFFLHAPGMYLIGLGYGMQRIGRLPMLSTDIPMHAFASEMGILRF